MKWEIYKNLKFLRQEKNLTVDELSKLSGVSKAKILSIERELSFEHNIEEASKSANEQNYNISEGIFLNSLQGYLTFINSIQ